MKCLMLVSLVLVPFFAQAANTGATVKVNGMVCSFCSTGIEKKFKEKSEVADVKVDLDSKTVVLKYAPEKELKDEQIRDVITKSGYTVVSIEHNGVPSAGKSAETKMEESKKNGTKN